MNHGSLFSGIGGFDYASDQMGWTNIFHCEIEPFPRKVLKYYWPNAISYDDIRKTDFTVHRGEIDILTGGFPCQPYSVAGSRKGTEDDRHLWPEMLRAIRELTPSCIVGENVPGIISWNEGMVFEEVCADLENEGYEVQPVILPAASVNAPHKRDRVWFVAYNPNTRVESLQSGRKDRVRRLNTTPNSGSAQLQERTPERNWPYQEEKGTRMDDRPERSGDFGNATNPGGTRLQELHIPTESAGSGYGAGGNYENGNGFERFPTQSPVCSRNDGFSARLDGITFPKWRNESIKAAGNAIVPQVALQIFKVIEQMNGE